MLDERKKIVLVDDNPINLKMARNTLMGKYDVFTVPSADKLFQLLTKLKPEIILLDVMMPQMSGYEAIGILKNNTQTADIPVIFLTSKSDQTSELEGFVHGAVDYISKPFSPQLLLKRVEVHVDLETAKKELKNYTETLEHRVEEKTAEILDLQNAMLITMSSMVEGRDDITGSHLERTERALELLLEEMVSEKIYAEIIETWNMKLFLKSAQLHDVGKISVQDSILMKPGPLTAEEFEEMKKHTTFGEKAIEKIEARYKECPFLTQAKIMAGAHHEKWDGTGYPRGLAGFDIPLEGRLMALVDVYDALISERPYKKAFPPAVAQQIIKEGCEVHFDPMLVDIFIVAAQRFQVQK